MRRMEKRRLEREENFKANVLQRFRNRSTFCMADLKSRFGLLTGSIYHGRRGNMCLNGDQEKLWSEIRDEAIKEVCKEDKKIFELTEDEFLQVREVIENFLKALTVKE